MTFKKMTKPQAKTLIRINRRLYQQKPNNILFALKALHLAKEYKFRTPLWAKHAVEDRYTDILNIRSKEDHGYSLLNALKISGRSFKHFHEKQDIFVAGIEFMVLVNDGMSITAAEKELAKKYQKLGGIDAVRKKVAPMRSILENGDPFPNPFSA